MDKLALSQLRDCWICYNNENNTNLTIVNSKKVLNNCRTYLDTSINIESFEKDTSVSCCNYCYESAVELIILEKQVEKLGKEISELSSLFLKTVLQRRKNFKKENDGRFDGLILPTDRCAVQKDECETPGLASKSQVVDLVNVVKDIGLETGEFENMNYSGEVEVECSDDQTFSEVVVPDDEQIEPNQEISGTIAEDCQQTIKTSIADLSKCFQMPIIQLERLQTCKRRRPKSAVDKISGDFNLETVKTETEIEENTPYKCSICGHDFGLCDLEDHEKLHINVHEFSCSFCDKSFVNPSRLKSHERLQAIKRRFNSSFNSKSIRTSTHEKFHSEDKPFKCSVCSKSFTKSSLLKRHETYHSENRRFQCSFCSKSFFFSTDVKRHETIHTGERSFKCSFCPKSFVVSRDLKQHETIHTGEKPFKCSLCPKSFRSAFGLKHHEEGHTGVRPYKCSFCHKSFPTLDDLTNHEAVHVRERPYKCSFCSKAFGSVNLVKRHEKIHSGDRPFKCESCEMTFVLNQHLKRHRQRKHGMNTKQFILP